MKGMKIMATIEPTDETRRAFEEAEAIFRGEDKPAGHGRKPNARTLAAIKEAEALENERPERKDL